MVSKEKPELSTSITFLSRGIKPQSKPLFPITEHHGESIFDFQKLKKYIVEEKNITYETHASVEQIEGESFSSTAQNFAAKFEAEASGNYGGAVFSGAVSSEFGLQKNESVDKKFSQLRKICSYAKIILPTPFLRDSLRGLLKDEILKLIDSIDSLELAQSVVESFGIYYMQSCTLGALLTMTTSTTESSVSTASKLSQELKAEVSYLAVSAKSKASMNMGVNNSSRNKNFSYNVSALGGDPAAILNGKEEEWIKSAVKDLACVKASFSPIFNLASKNSKAEKLLKQAVEEKYKCYQKDFDKFKSQLKTLQYDPAENEMLYYYWRQYGNNYPILYKCSESEYKDYKDKYDGSGALAKSAKKWGGVYLNFDRHFVYSDMIIPGLSYCSDTYLYHYNKTTYGKMAESINAKGLTAEKLKHYLA